MIIYIASPYTNYCDKQAAVDAQIDAFAILRDLGHEPIAPLLSHYIDQRHPASYERWLQWCLAMVGACDVVLRLPGDSDGADREVAEAKKLGKPVVYSIDKLSDIRLDTYVSMPVQTESAILDLLYEIMHPEAVYDENRLTMAHEAIRRIQGRAKEITRLMMGGKVRE